MREGESTRENMGEIEKGRERMWERESMGERDNYGALYWHPANDKATFYLCGKIMIDVMEHGFIIVHIQVQTYTRKDTQSEIFYVQYIQCILVNNDL